MYGLLSPKISHTHISETVKIYVIEFYLKACFNSLGAYSFPKFSVQLAPAVNLKAKKWKK